MKWILGEVVLEERMLETGTAERRKCLQGERRQCLREECYKK